MLHPFSYCYSFVHRSWQTFSLTEVTVTFYKFMFMSLGSILTWIYNHIITMDFIPFHSIPAWFQSLIQNSNSLSQILILKMNMVLVYNILASRLRHKFYICSLHKCASSWLSLLSLRNYELHYVMSSSSFFLCVHLHVLFYNR